MEKKELKTCGYCNGSGRKYHVQMVGRISMLMPRICPYCHGKGKK